MFRAVYCAAICRATRHIAQPSLVWHSWPTVALFCWNLVFCYLLKRDTQMVITENTNSNDKDHLAGQWSISRPVAAIAPAASITGSCWLQHALNEQRPASSFDNVAQTPSSFRWGFFQSCLLLSASIHYSHSWGKSFMKLRNHLQMTWHDKKKFSK